MKVSGDISYYDPAEDEGKYPRPPKNKRFRRLTKRRRRGTLRP
jgi:hypothetical protein